MIYEAERRAKAEAAFDRFTAKYGAKYDKAVTCLTKDRVALLAFYDLPAEPLSQPPGRAPFRDRIKGLLAFDGSTSAARTIEITFATVRLRTDKTKGCLSRETGLALVFKLAKSAERHWRRLEGANRLGQLIEGIRFRDGEAVQGAEHQAAA